MPIRIPSGLSRPVSARAAAAPTTARPATALSRYLSSSTTPVTSRKIPITRPTCLAATRTGNPASSTAAQPPRSRSLTTTPQSLQSSSSSSSSSITPPPPPPQQAEAASAAPNSRWIDDLRARIGKCIIFGCDQAQAQRTARLLAAISGEWRDLLAGSHGFLTPGLALSSAKELLAEDPSGSGGSAAAGWGGGGGSYERMGLLNRGVTWGDMDSFGHVNNTVYNKWAESARVNWLTHFAALDPAHGNEWRQLMTMKSVGLILQSITTKYKMPIIYPDTVSVYFRLTRAMPTPTPYLNLQSLILSHKNRRVAATTDEVIVVYDYQAARKTDLPAFAAPLMDQTWRLQQVAARKAAARIAELERGVRELERETWDHADAVEDMGGKVR